MAYIFDGINKIITFDVSTINLDIGDLWSRYIDWILTDDNGKYLLAMRNVGGDQLPGSKALGITYFMLNGWKIKPYEEDHTLNVNGNLYSEDGTSPYTQVSGPYQVMIINSVSSLVDSTVKQLPEIEHSSFENKITLDTINGVSGTLYPIGTPKIPVNNLNDAKIIAAYRGFKHIHLQSELIITTGQNIDELHFVSDNWLKVTIESGVSTQNTQFDKISLYGEFDGFWNILNDCWVYDITNFCGWLRGGSFVNVKLAPYTVESAGQSYFDEIVPMYPNEYSTITCNLDTSIAISSHTGRLRIKEMNDNCIIEVGFRTGKLHLDNTNIGGQIKVRGVCELLDESTGTIVDDDTLNIVTIKDSVWMGGLPETYTEGQAGYILEQIKILTEELYKIQGLDKDSPMTITRNVRTAGDIELKIEGDGETLSIISRQ